MVGRSIGKSTPRDKPALIKGIRQGGYTYTIQRFASNKEKYNAAIIWAFGTAPPPSHALKADWISMRSSSNSPSRGRFPYSWRVKRFSYSTKRGNAPYAVAQGWGSKGHHTPSHQPHHRTSTHIPSHPTTSSHISSHALTSSHISAHTPPIFRKVLVFTFFEVEKCYVLHFSKIVAADRALHPIALAVIFVHSL